MAFHKRTGSIPALHQTGYVVDPVAAEAPAHHHHQVLYVCRGHCSGPQCDFTQSLKQWHSTVWLGSERGNPDGVPGFQSQVMASAPKALEKLDQKRQTLHQLKEVLAQKLESKNRHKSKKLLKSIDKRPSSALPAPTSGLGFHTSSSPKFQPSHQQRPASAMVARPQSRSNAPSSGKNAAGKMAETLICVGLLCLSRS